MTKINLRIISKSHAHLQSMVKTSVKFYKNLNITVGEVACTNYSLSFTFIIKMSEKKSVKKLLEDYIKTTCTSSKHGQDICKVSKESEYNCRRSCLHKVHTPIGGRKDGRTE